MDSFRANIYGKIGGQMNGPDYDYTCYGNIELRSNLTNDETFKIYPKVNSIVKRKCSLIRMSYSRFLISYSQSCEIFYNVFLLL